MSRRGKGFTEAELVYSLQIVREEQRRYSLCSPVKRKYAERFEEMMRVVVRHYPERDDAPSATRQVEPEAARAFGAFLLYHESKVDEAERGQDMRVRSGVVGSSAKNPCLEMRLRQVVEESE